MATIMVIDDEASIRSLLREVLEKAGHNVVEAKDGREALSLYQKNKADLLIMDLLMPEVDGLGSNPATDQGIHGYENHCHDRRAGRSKFS